MTLTDTGENVQKCTRVGKKEENSVATFGRFRLWTIFVSSPVSVKKPQIEKLRAGISGFRLVGVVWQRD